MGFHARVWRMRTSTVPWSRSDGDVMPSTSRVDSSPHDICVLWRRQGLPGEVRRPPSTAGHPAPQMASGVWEPRASRVHRVVICPRATSNRLLSEASSGARIFSVSLTPGGAMAFFVPLFIRGAALATVLAVVLIVDGHGKVASLSRLFGNDAWSAEQFLSFNALWLIAF